MDYFLRMLSDKGNCLSKHKQGDIQFTVGKGRVCVGGIG